ncbi:antitoxin [Brachybacterium alimentarium]|uniref:antitoxin n=1 Tax=Brachybacterium alimentarium TaxID=47845 RepID=UPI003FD124EC
MGFDDALNKAKDVAGKHSDQANQGIDAATDKVKDRTPGQFDKHVDSGGDAARDQLGLGGDKDKGGKGDKKK